MPKVPTAFLLLLAAIAPGPARGGGPFTTEVRINVINKAGTDFELVGPGQTSNKNGHKRAATGGAVVAGGLVTASIAQQTATAYAIAQGTSWVSGMFGASALSGAASSSASAILWSAGFTVGLGGLAGGLAAYGLFSLIKTELLQVGIDNPGSFWFKKGKFIEPFLDPAFIPSDASGKRTGHTLVMAGSGWSGVGGWLRLNEVGSDGEYRPRYVNIAYSNYLRNDGCKFYASYGERMEGDDLVGEQKYLGDLGSRHEGEHISWRLRSVDDETCEIDVTIGAMSEAERHAGELAHGQRMEDACRNPSYGWTDSSGRCSCQALSDKFYVAHGLTYGVAPAVAVEWWQKNHCETSPQVCDFFGCTCQGMSDSCGSRRELPEGTKEDAQCQAAADWFTATKCKTRPGGPWMQIYNEELVGPDGTKSAGFEFVNVARRVVKHGKGDYEALGQQGGHWKSIGHFGSRKEATQAMLRATTRAINNPPPEGFIPACLDMGVCSQDCDPASPQGCSDTCQALVDKYDIVAGLTWGSASKDVMAYFELKQCNKPSHGKPAMPQRCAEWGCSCRAAKYDREALDSLEGIDEWADRFCWWLPQPDLVEGMYSEKYSMVHKYAAFPNTAIRLGSGLRRDLDRGEVKPWLGGLTVEKCLGKCSQNLRCVAMDFMEPSSTFRRNRCYLYRLGPPTKFWKGKRVDPMMQLIRGGRGHDFYQEEDMPEGTWTTYVLPKKLHRSVRKMMADTGKDDQNDSNDDTHDSNGDTHTKPRPRPARPVKYATCAATQFCDTEAEDGAKGGPCCYPSVTGKLAVFDCSKPANAIGDLGSWVERRGGDVRRCSNPNLAGQQTGVVRQPINQHISLPSGWSQKYDASSGKTYYQGMSCRAPSPWSWTPPTCLPLPAGYKKACDSKSQRVYYVDGTGRSRWQPPGMASDGHLINLPQRWWAKRDQRGDWYFVDAAGQSQWEDPRSTYCR